MSQKMFKHVRVPIAPPGKISGPSKRDTLEKILETEAKEAIAIGKTCEICGLQADFDCEHISGRSTYRCGMHAMLEYNVTGRERKL